MELKLTTQLFLLTPGIVFIFGMALITSGGPPSVTKDTIGGYIAVSLVYALAAVALKKFPVTLANAPGFVELAGAKLPKRLWGFMYGIPLPFVLGCLWGAGMRRGLLYDLFRALGLHPVHPARTAWEGAFGGVPSDARLIATLKDGTTLTGRFLSASSDTEFPDLYLGDVDPPEGQTKGLIRSAWISPTELRSVEIVARDDHE
jgi:hypothetical protein